MDPLRGLDDVSWADLEHAYGPATDVPTILRELLSPTFTVREGALDAYWGAVHHQGDVYDSTVATVPFLIAAALSPSTPDRSIVLELLESLAPRPAPFDETPIHRLFANFPPQMATDEHRTQWLDRSRAMHRRRIECHQLIKTARDTLSVLTESDDTAVVIGAVKVLRCVSETSYAPALERCLATASTVTLQLELIEGLRHDPDTAAALSALEREFTSPEARLRAWLVRCALGGDFEWQDALALFHGLYSEPAHREPSPEEHSDSLLGTLSMMEEEFRRRRTFPLGARLLAPLFALDEDNVSKQSEFLERLLEHPCPEAQEDAMAGIKQLISDWRGDHKNIVRRVGARLSSDHAEVARWACWTLGDAGSVAAAAIDDIVVWLQRAPVQSAPDRQNGWLIGDDLAPLPYAAARLRLGATLPMFARLLEREAIPQGLGKALAAFGPAAASLAPAAARRARESLVPSDLTIALGHFGVATPEVLDAILAEHPSILVEALAPLGARARGALDQLNRRLRSSGDPSLALAHWRIAADADAVLPFLEGLDAETVDALGEIGPAAISQAPRLRTIDPGSPLAAASTLALARITGEGGDALRSLWDAGGAIRLKLAEAARTEAPIAAMLKERLAAELESRRRFRAESDDLDRVVVDERLMAHCRAALAP